MDSLQEEETSKTTTSSISTSLLQNQDKQTSMIKFDTSTNFPVKSGFYSLIHLPSMSQITEKIFLGNYPAAKDFKLLQKNKITHILVCGKELDCVFPEKFTYLKLNMDPYQRFNDKLLDFLTQALDFMRKADVVYVHCMHGVCRSASIVIAYLINQKYSYAKARAFVQERRPCVSPWSSFVKELQLYEESFKSRKIDQFFKKVKKE